MWTWSIPVRISSADELVLAAAACIVVGNHRKPRRYWVRPSFQARPKYSGSDLTNYWNRDHTDPLISEFRCDISMKQFLRVSCPQFSIFYNFLSLHF